jgi:hypothetical protein
MLNPIWDGTVLPAGVLRPRAWVSSGLIHSRQTGRDARQPRRHINRSARQIDTEVVWPDRHSEFP